MSVFAAVYVMALVGLAPANDPLPNVGETTVVEQKLLKLFENRCAQCHDSARGGIKGDFGYVLDLDRLAREADVIKPGNPDASLLHELCFAGEMPPKPPLLTTTEVKLIHNWIFSLARLPAPPERLDLGKPPVPATSNVKRFVLWVGHFHPVMVHFPVALLMGAALAEVIQLARHRRGRHPASRFCLTVGAVMGIVAALLGWAYAGPWQGDGILGALHRWMGTGIALLASLASFLFCSVSDGTNGRKLAAYRAVLIIMALLVATVGFLGGALHYGLDHYAW